VNPPPRIRSASAGPEHRGQRLDLWLVEFEESLSRSRIQKLIEDGHVRVDREVQPARYRMRGDEQVEWEVPEVEPSELSAQADVEFEIVHEDEHLAVIDKPAGLVVHPAPGHATGTLVNGLLARLDGLSGVGGVERPGLVHRLDKDTSGLLVVAKNDSAHRALQEQLRDRSLSRIYRAICWGCPDPEKGEIEAALDRHPRDRKRRAVVQGGKEALTHYRVLRRLVGSALLELRLTTGRTHQIRVHLAHLGHPVLGDELYGGDLRRLRGAHQDHRIALRAALAAMGRQALHAAELAFVHPASQERMTFRSPLPNDFESALAILEEREAG